MQPNQARRQFYVAQLLQRASSLVVGEKVRPQGQGVCDLFCRRPLRAAEDRGHVGESHADAESYEMSRFRFRIASAVVDPPERNDASWSYL